MASALHLVGLPNELLLLIVDFLCEVNSLPATGCECETIIFTCHLRPLSLVCQRLRRLCLSRLFCRPKITHTKPLRLLTAKCAVDPHFVRLIRRLDLTHVESPEEREDRNLRRTRHDFVHDGYYYGPDILPALLPCLKSLEWLDLNVDQINGDLLSLFNSHPSLATVAVLDARLDAVRALSLATPLSLSKIRVHSAISLRLQSPAMHSLMSRSLRIAHLILRDAINLRVGPGTLFLPGIETLEIRLGLQAASPMSWLPAFVERHTSLKAIKFSGRGSIWSKNPDILFASQFLQAVERESLTLMVDLLSFSISRTRSTSSLDTWPLVHLELLIPKGAGVSALCIACQMAPHLLSLDVKMSRFDNDPVHTDDLISSLSIFPSLRRLELHRAYNHLVFEGQAPWVLPPSKAAKRTSNCLDAHRALRWVTACVAQRALSLDFVHITDQGYDSLNGRIRDQWSLSGTYGVRRNGNLELYGTTKFVAADRFQLCDPAPSNFIVNGGQCL
ncbi:hypothetical protein DFH06DRAFT_597847 [Mycena polygramma]|nr:hypothetical protein DFH06DRAFT_597847 [Mycena polygramma]